MASSRLTTFFLAVSLITRYIIFLSLFIWSILFIVILPVRKLSCFKDIWKSSVKKESWSENWQYGYYFIQSPHRIYCSLFSSVDYSHQGQLPIIKLTLWLTFSTMSSCDFIFYSEMNIQYWSLPHQSMHWTKFSSTSRRYRQIYFYLILHIVWYNMQKFFRKIFALKYWFKIASPDYLFTLILRDNEREIQTYLDSTFWNAKISFFKNWYILDIYSIVYISDIQHINLIYLYIIIWLPL